jgi:hypothetical protein
MINARLVGGPADGLTLFVEDLKCLEIFDPSTGKANRYRRLSYTVIPPEGAVYVPDGWTDREAAEALFKERFSAPLKEAADDLVEVRFKARRLGQTILQSGLQAGIDRGLMARALVGLKMPQKA